MTDCLSVRDVIKIILQLCSGTHRDDSEGLNKAGGRHVVCDVKRVGLLCDFISFPFSELFQGGKVNAMRKRFDRRYLEQRDRRAHSLFLCVCVCVCVCVYLCAHTWKILKPRRESGVFSCGS